MDWLKDWIKIVAGTVMTLTVIRMLLPAGKSRKAALTVAGFILLSVLLNPLFRLLGGLNGLAFPGLPAFLAEEDRQQLLEEAASYSQEQLAIIIENYKARLAGHINAFVKALPQIGEAESQVEVNEDYTGDKFGAIEKIFIKAKKSEDGRSSGKKSSFEKVKKIEKITIDSRGISVKKTPGQEPEEGAAGRELAELIKRELSREFLIDESLITVEVTG